MGEINGHFLCTRRGGISHSPWSRRDMSWLAILKLNKMQKRTLKLKWMANIIY
jgi:hypothetical protein